MEKKIHRIWVQGKKHFREKEPLFYSYISLWDKYFPSYECKTWGEEDYLELIEKFSTKLLEVYRKAPNFGCKSDIARLVVLYYHGGFYFDTDYEPFKNFEYLIIGNNLKLVLVGMNLCKSKIYFGGYKYSNAWIYAGKKCPYISKLLKQISNSPYIKGRSKFDYTWNVTGPGALTQLVEELNLDKRDDVRILSHSVIEVADFSKTNLINKSKEEILRRYPFVVGVHRMNASWMDNADFLKKLGVFYSFYNEYHDYFGILSLVIIFILIFSNIYLVYYSTPNDMNLRICEIIN